MKAASVLLARLGLVGLALVFVAGCGRDSAAGLPEIKPATTTFPIKVGGATVQARLAVLPAEMTRGLMEVTSMPADEGMLFVYTRPSSMQFWMRNTLIPLDIGFFDARGELREVHPMYPNDDRSVVSRGSDLQFALEMNQGWFRDRGVRPGARLDLGDLQRALEARGFQPEQFGLR